MGCLYYKKEDKMGKKIQKRLFIIVTFILCFIVIKVIMDKCNLLDKLIYFLKLQQKNAELINKITVIINSIFSLIATTIIDILKLWLEYKWDTKKGMPEISIIINAVTCIRKTKRKYSFFDVDIGKGTCFVYVISVLKNIGEGTIVECWINKSKLEINLLNENDCYDFCFRVYRKENKKYKRSYKINLLFKDDRGISYEGKYKLKINEEKQSAEIIVKKKQRRR